MQAVSIFPWVQNQYHFITLSLFLFPCLYERQQPHKHTRCTSKCITRTKISNGCSLGFVGLQSVGLYSANQTKQAVNDPNIFSRHSQKKRLHWTSQDTGMGLHGNHSIKGRRKAMTINKNLFLRCGWTRSLSIQGGEGDRRPVNYYPFCFSPAKETEIATQTSILVSTYKIPTTGM